MHHTGKHKCVCCYKWDHVWKYNYQSVCVVYFSGIESMLTKMLKYCMCSNIQLYYYVMQAITMHGMHALNIWDTFNRLFNADKSALKVCVSTAKIHICIHVIYMFVQVQDFNFMIQIMSLFSCSTQPQHTRHTHFHTQLILHLLDDLYVMLFVPVG